MSSDSTKTPFSCVLLGGQALLIQCGDELLSRGHRIDAVVSNDVATLNWARERGLDGIPNDAAVYDVLMTKNFDYLFSIVNLALVPERIIKLAHVAAINFHDGPLPDYAGLNTPTWALLNQREEHGVTWHEMLADVDQGAILRQARFPIGEEDTSFTLNARCFEAGFQTFTDLVGDIESHSITRTEQDLSTQEYFARADRPYAAAIIDWRQPVAAINRVARALNYGPYANPMTTLKLWLGDGVVAVGELSLAEGNGTPGTVLSTDEVSITVAASDGAVRLAEFKSLDGRVLNVPELGISVEQSLAVLDDEVLSAIDECMQAVCKSELFWQRRLAAVEAIEVPYVKSGVKAEHSEWQLASQTLAADALVNVVGHLTDSEGETDGLDDMLFALQLYFSRIGTKDSFDLFIGLDSQWRDPAATTLFSSRVPVHVDIDPKVNAKQNASVYSETLAKARSKQTFTHDLVQRHEELAATASMVREGFSVMIDCVQDQDDYSPLGVSDLLIAVHPGGRQLDWYFNGEALSLDIIERMQAQLTRLLSDIAERPRTPVSELRLLSDEEQGQLQSWNATSVDYDASQCVHQLFEACAANMPDQQALAFEETTLSYAELNQRANQVARLLKSRGIAEGQLVGVLMDRSERMIIAMMAILKSGAAYVPLDPTYPRDRLAYMVEDSELVAVLSEAQYDDFFPGSDVPILALDRLAGDLDALSSENLNLDLSSSHLAYVIYTSGSTGKPKGVMVEHRNVVNFFVGMDARIGGETPGVWLAVTSISFDISVLEIFWTLARGFKVVLYADRAKQEAAKQVGQVHTQHPDKHMDFSLFYWNLASEEDKADDNKYRLLMESAEFGDNNGFCAVWTPERHFHEFGGLYPNPSVTSAALAMKTKNVDIRAGSCVIPLHSPIRVAEEWSVVDNLSNGRVGLAMASGWQPTDFAIKPENHADAKNKLFEYTETVRQLWRGETVEFEGPKGPVNISTLPRPKQSDLPVWITTAGNPETFRMAGERGYGILTHLLGQTVEKVGENLEIYRQARRDAGHEGDGHVVLMLHTLVGHNEEAVKEAARAPMKRYLESAMFLVKDAAWHFPTFKEMSAESGKTLDEFFETISPEDLDGLLEFAFERYYGANGLFGTPERCMKIIDDAKSIGVTEIACLIDYGVATDTVLAHLPALADLVKQANKPAPKTLSDEDLKAYTLPKLIEQHEVTHMQCTPSMASMLTSDSEAHAALSKLQQVMIGGEAFPLELAESLDRLSDAKVTNMYGPTETTIWSATHQIQKEDLGAGIPIGTPIANTQIYLLDSHQQPVPNGVPGELVIAGDGVVRGYFKRPELTAERFLPDSFSEQAGARMYRTGDLARYREDGVLEFLGRIDHQIKIRGYRIELGEIEVAIQQVEGVRSAVVLLREDTPGDKRLVAYLIEEANAQVCEIALRERLSQQMPEFMVPSVYVKLPAFPLTPNGKVDRKSMPLPASEGQKASKAEYVQPQNELESMITAVWQDVLGRDQVGIHDNFFDIGGHSLLVVQVLNKLRGETEKTLQMTDMFRYTTVAALAQYLGGEDDTSSVDSGKSRAASRKEMRNRRRRR